MKQAQSFDHNQLLSSLPDNIQSVLDVGCMGEDFLRLIGNRNPSSKMFRADCFGDAGKQDGIKFEETVTLNVEKHPLPYDKGFFDVMIYANVLGLLKDPWRVLTEHAAYLKENGVVITRMPNVYFYRVRQMLKKNRWDYTDSGITAKVQLRYFTKSGMEELISKAGLKVISMHRMMGGSNKRNFYNRLLGGIWDDGLAEQYIFVARKD